MSINSSFPNYIERRRVVIKSEKSLKRYSITIPSLAVALILVLGYFFIAKAANGLYNEKTTYLEEISLKGAENVRRQIEGYFSTIEAIATVVGNNDSFNTDYTMTILSREADKNFFKRMGIIFPSGEAITTDGHTLDFSEREYFKQAMEGRSTASDCLRDMVDNHEINVIATPIYHKKSVVGVIFATQTQEQLSQALRIESFGGEGYSYIINSDGRPVVKTTHPGSLGEYENLFDVMALNGLDYRKIDELRAGIDAGIPGSVEAVRDGEKRHMYYAPVGINDWYIISVIPTTVISQQSDQLIRNLGFLVFLMVASAIVICSKMIMFLQNNNKYLSKIAYTDPLTGYANWPKFALDAAEILEHCEDKRFAIITFDINKFKVINDMFSFQSGDDILKFVANVLAKSLGESEIFCRSSADNFCILMQYESDPVIISRIVKIASEIESYIANYKIKISLGVYVINETIFDLSLLSDRANISKGIAKKQNQDTNYHFFRDENRQEILHEKEIENVMDDALKNNEFEIYLQPKYLSSSDKIVGAEALVRWNRSGVGLMSPGDFIPLFEKNGFIRKLDVYMFEGVCRMLANWQERFPDCQPVAVSVNISRVHLSKSTLPQDLLAIARQYGVNPENIEIELTESAVFENLEEMKEIMWRIKEAGFMISIDDFGSGYSSFASLKHLPADFVKLDKSFLDEAENDSRGENIIGSMISMIKNLGMRSVAEGVETSKQLDFLKSVGCDIVQGYYRARPMPIAAFEKLKFGEEK